MSEISKEVTEEAERLLPCRCDPAPGEYHLAQCPADCRAAVAAALAARDEKIATLQAQHFDAMGELGAFVTMDRDLRAQLAEVEKERDEVKSRLISALSRIEVLKAERDALGGQINRLANFIMSEVPGEPSQSEGAVDCAIRIIAAASKRERDAAKIEGMVRAKTAVLNVSKDFKGKTGHAEVDLKIACIHAIDAEIAKAKEGKSNG
jgi:hypothetical protein